MKKGISYIEVIIAITIATICFIPLLNMLYISAYSNKVSKNIYYANLLSKNMITEIESNLKNEPFLKNDFLDLTDNNDFDTEYMTETFDYYVHIQKSNKEIIEFNTNTLLSYEVNNELISTNNIFDAIYDENYDIIIKNYNTLEIIKGEEFLTITDEIFINNENDFMKVCILNEKEDCIVIKSSTNNNMQISIVGEYLEIINNINGNIIYADDIYINNYYIINVVVYEENKIIASNFKIVNR